MPVVGLTSLADNWNGSVTLSFNATGFSTASVQNDNGYELGVSYLSVKMNAQLPSVSEASDTYWVTKVLFYWLILLKTYGQSRGTMVFLWKLSTRIDLEPEPKYIMTLSRVTPKALEFQALRLII